MIIGLCAGSFFNVVIYRMPRMLHRFWHREATHYLKEYPEPLNLPSSYNLFMPRSYCPSCQRQIAWWHNIPIVSFMVLRGRCGCGAKISWRYPLVELLTAIVMVLVAIRIGWDWRLWPAFIFTGYLMVMAMIDYQQQLLLDELTLGLLWLGLLANYAKFYTELDAAVLGAVLGYLSLWTIAKLFYLLTRREGMGYGDFKLLAALGAWLGWQALPLVIFFACLLGILVTVSLHCLKRTHLSHPIPFGPYLAIGGWFYFLYAESLLPALYGYYGS